MDLPIKPRCFANTKAALKDFAASAPKRNVTWETAESNADVDEVTAADALAVKAVQDAFHKDTHDINSLENCRRISIQDIERMVRA